MSKDRTIYQHCYGSCFITITNASDTEAKILRSIIQNEAGKLNHKIKVELHDARMYYNEPKKLLQEID